MWQITGGGGDGGGGDGGGDNYRRSLLETNVVAGVSDLLRWEGKSLGCNVAVLLWHDHVMHCNAENIVQAIQWDVFVLSHLLSYDDVFVPVDYGFPLMPWVPSWQGPLGFDTV